MTSAGLGFAVLEEKEPIEPHNELETLYGRCLKFSEANWLAANFVVSIDGATTFAEGDSKAIGMHSAEDRLLMAMLRASASVVVLGASTLRAAPTHQWTANALAPDRKKALDDLRKHITGLDVPAPLLVVSSSGDLPKDHVALCEPETETFVLTTSQGADKLGGFPKVKPFVSSAVKLIPAAEIVNTAKSLGTGLMLCEGGPHLFGQLLAAHLVDELFLTVSPQVAGGDGHRLVEAFGGDPDSAAHSELLSVRSVGDHLFLRYRFE